MKLVSLPVPDGTFATTVARLEAWEGQGVALPLEPIKEFYEGQKVIITFLDEERNEALKKDNTVVVALEDLLRKSEIDAGISDLAEQHDHYLYGKSKK